MPISAEIIADSINAATGDRLTTFKVRFPKCLIAEVNTHRALSRNWSSSRAVPAKKVREMVIRDPWIPTHWGRNQKGMQASQELTGWKLAIAKLIWRFARFPACFFHWLLGDVIGLHKQVCNRILEPWMWADGVLSSTEWKNFFQLRKHPDAQPDFKELASQMLFLYDYSNPQEVKPLDWHLPFVDDGAVMPQSVSTARCARVSYYLRDGQRSDENADKALCDRLIGSVPRHMSPAEHPAMALSTRERCGNYVGWKQYRKFFEDEAGGDYANL